MWLETWVEAYQLSYQKLNWNSDEPPTFDKIKNALFVVI